MTAWLSFLTLLISFAHIAFAIRAILRPHRKPAARVAWIVFILVAPLVGIIAYLLVGEANVGQRRQRREVAALQRLPPAESTAGLGTAPPSDDVPARLEPLFRTGQSVNGFAPVDGNSATLFEDSADTIDALVADIETAREHVHISFYIWLPDDNGVKVAEALKQAVARGVACRVIADSLGSRHLVGSPHWHAMRAAGVTAIATLKVGWPLLRALGRRVDIRNHRKIVVIDNRITYCGSQNCADAEFLVKASFGPWVDMMMRFEGPIARQNQYLFASHWMTSVDEDLSPLLREAIVFSNEGFTAQATGTGPTVRPSAMAEVFASVINAARRELIVTTPYYVPDEFLQSTLCGCSRRGVKTILIVPARNDSRLVAYASRSYYEDLLESGVRIFEFAPGVLHAKTMVADSEVVLVGSSNLDRRSFELNYENNILLVDRDTAKAVRRRQEEFIASATEVTLSEVRRWSPVRRFINNAVAMFSPLL